MNNLILSLIINCCVAITLTEIFVKKGFLNKLRDNLKEKYAQRPTFINSILNEWFNCEICSTAQSMYVLALVSLLTQNYLLATLTACFAQPLGLLVKIIYNLAE